MIASLRATAIIAAILATPITSNAAQVWVSGKIRTVNINKNGNDVGISFQGNPDLCSGTSNNKWARVVAGENWATQAGVDKIFSLVTAAKISNATINVLVDANAAGTGCDIYQVTIDM